MMSSTYDGQTKPALVSTRFLAISRTPASKTAFMKALP